jgi:hypothetical protein
MAVCLACGVKLSELLARCASLRCADCRDANAPLRPELVKKAA